MIDQHIKDFNNNIIGLREFVDLIDPFLNKQIDEHHEHIIPFFQYGLISELLAGNKDLGDEEIENLKANKLNLEEKIRLKFPKIPEVIVRKVEKGNERKVEFTFTVADQNLQRHFKAVTKKYGYIDLLYTNSLISCLSSVELFFSQLLHYFYDRYPESAGVQKRTMTLNELKGFDSISDAEKYLIDSKIEEVLRGNIESWIHLLKSELSFGLSYLSEMTDELVEIYQRRNLLVHNGGVVNSIYIAKVKQELRKDFALDSRLKVDKDYLDKSICKLQKTFLLISAELWKKTEPNNESRGEVLGELVYENLLYSRWEIAEGLSYFILRDSCTDPVDKVIAQLNFWLCKKELGQFNAIKDEISKADYSDKKEIFQLGLYALRDDIKSFFEILPTALESKQINIERLEEFPILREIRNTQEYKEFKEKSKYFREDNQEVEKVVEVKKID
ncbi:MAG: hypothetical protein AMXMBFR48_06330 [Ignavibacteriales bacterium]